MIKILMNGDGVVSRKSVAALVLRLVTTPGLEVRSSLGVHKASSPTASA